MNEINKENSETINDVSPYRKFWKLKIFFFLALISLFIIIGRLFYLQIIKAEDYQKLAKAQNEAKYSLKPQRGNIYDRNGKLLVSSSEAISFALDPKLMTDELERQLLSGMIASELRKDSSDILESINKAEGSFVWLARGIAPKKANGLDTFKHLAFIIKKEPQRNYLYANYAAHLIGCTDIDNIGLAGIERRWDSLLKGKPGFMVMLRDARGHLHPAADLPAIKEKDGYGLELTIDIDLQRIAEYELRKAASRSNAASGSVIAMDPKTGEILAIASYPPYNPNDLSTATDSSMKNRAISDTYEPGSTFKIITASAILEGGIIDEKDTVDGLDGTLEFKDYTLKDEHPLGRVPFSEAVVYSSNIVFSNLGNEIPDALFYKYIRDFGFGNRLGIDVPGERSGSVKKPKEFDMATKRFLGFGYGLSVTPLQILSAFATVANDGKMMRPYVVKKILGNDGNPLKVFEPSFVRNVINEKTANVLTDLLVQVVDRGTGVNAKLEGINIAGKTGTAQQYISGSYKTKSYTASFAGFFPADDPKVAMVIVLDKPRGNYYGGSVAAPVFKRICQRWLNISRFSEKSNGKLDSAFVPNIIGCYVEDAIDELDIIGFQLENYKRSDNIVISQQPTPGEFIAKGTDIRIEEYEITSHKADTINNEDYLPDLSGLPLKKAITVLHKFGYKAKVSGSGIVHDQKWIINRKPKTCVLICK
jgi:cell division protein FtsI/penicillin-binding protein 2